MSRHLFGWSYPPGAANDPFAPYNQQEGPCGVCGHFENECICPECPTCGSVGDPRCYNKIHGLTRSAEQEQSLAAHEAEWAETARQEAEAEAAWIHENFDDEET